jgi:hypothetical protein
MSRTPSTATGDVSDLKSMTSPLASACQISAHSARSICQHVAADLRFHLLALLLTEGRLVIGDFEPGVASICSLNAHPAFPAPSFEGRCHA